MSFPAPWSMVPLCSSLPTIRMLQLFACAPVLFVLWLWWVLFLIGTEPPPEHSDPNQARTIRYQRHLYVKGGITRRKHVTVHVCLTWPSAETDYWIFLVDAINSFWILGYRDSNSAPDSCENSKMSHFQAIAVIITVLQRSLLRILNI